MLERSVGGGGRHLRVGLYCSLSCLATAGDRLAEAERDVGARRGLPAGVERDRLRLVDIAQTLLHQGATIRAAGDQLEVPTSTLRHWLREAGVRVGADGTLTGPADLAPPRGMTGKDRGDGKPGAATGHGTLSAAGRPRSAPPATGGSPVQALNELAQAGYVADVAWETGAEGAAHQPLFTCTVTATVTGIAGPVRARATGGSKAAAKASAAAALLAALADDDPVAEGAPLGRE